MFLGFLSINWTVWNIQKLANLIDICLALLQFATAFKLKKFMSSDFRNQDLTYHRYPTPGKLSISIKKTANTIDDLSLAYSPGVAYPVMEISQNPKTVYDYTNKGNLVAVISNGTAILGLGNLGAEAAKPVMEGKGLLFKQLAGIDVFDLELDCSDPDLLIQIVKALEPTFGGVNLEDIKAPECFYIEEKLKQVMRIPVFHDDQHGTAIVVGAGIINALLLANKNINQIKVVINGAGAAGIACAQHLVNLGVAKNNIYMCDSLGVIYRGRTENMNKYKEIWAVETNLRSLADVLVGADVFIGLSVKDVLTPEMLLSMNDNPIVFALANPDPEIDYNLAHQTRSDIIMATGRSDYSNQINNLLAFPYIFRAALDVRATKITDKMKLAATYALAELARQPVDERIKIVYKEQQLDFGKKYIIPKPLDPRLLEVVTVAVIKAAYMDNMAQLEIPDLEEYVAKLNQLRSIKF